MEKYVTINEEGFSIRGKIYTRDMSGIGRVILFGHGFGGHKDNKAAERFAKHILEKNKGVAVMTFDWPCHGNDARKKLRLEECDTYLRLVLDFIRSRFSDPKVYAYATSFGAFLFLKYMAEHGTPFVKAALRSPAVNMYESITGDIMTDSERNLIGKGKPAQVGFDRKVEIDREFLESLEQADIRRIDFLDYADDILIIHGTKDEIIPFDVVKEFSEQNVIELIDVEDADHRFQNPLHMDAAIAQIAAFFGMK